MVNPFNSDLNKINSRRLDLTTQLNEQTKEMKEISDEQASLFQEYSSSQNEVNTIEAQLSQIYANIRNYDNKTQEHIYKRNELEQNLSDITSSKPSLADFQKTVKDENGKTVTLTDTDAYNEALQKWEKEKAEVEKQIDENEKTITMYISAAEALDREKIGLELKLERLNGTQNELKYNSEELDSKIKIIDDEISKLQKEMEQIDAMQDVKLEVVPTDIPRTQYVIDDVVPSDIPTETNIELVTEFVTVTNDPVLPDSQADNDSNNIKNRPPQKGRFDELN